MGAEEQGRSDQRKMREWVREKAAVEKIMSRKSLRFEKEIGDELGVDKAVIV